MAPQVKSNAFGSIKVKNWENGQSYGLDANSGFFSGTYFLRSMALNEVMPHMLRDHGSWTIDGGNQIMISHFNEMISTTTLVTKVSVHVPKP
jgi:hypothetical protein